MGEKMIDILLKFYLNNMLILNILICIFLLISIIVYIIYKEKIHELYLKYKEIINYVIVGALTTLVSIGSYWLLRFVIKNYVILSILSWIFAVAFAYFTNRAFVFESKEEDFLKEISKFVSCRLLTLGMEVVLMVLFVSVLHINDMISKIILQVVVLVSNYLLSKLFVFAKKTLD